jgi:hypothetical protein
MIDFGSSRVRFSSLGPTIRHQQLLVQTCISSLPPDLAVGENRPVGIFVSNSSTPRVWTGLAGIQNDHGQGGGLSKFAPSGGESTNVRAFCSGKRTHVSNLEEDMRTVTETWVVGWF